MCVTGRKNKNPPTASKSQFVRLSRVREFRLGSRCWRDTTEQRWQLCCFCEGETTTVLLCRTSTRVRRQTCDLLRVYHVVLLLPRLASSPLFPLSFLRGVKERERKTNALLRARSRTKGYRALFRLGCANLDCPRPTRH